MGATQPRALLFAEKLWQLAANIYTHWRVGSTDCRPSCTVSVCPLQYLRCCRMRVLLLSLVLVWAVRAVSIVWPSVDDAWQACQRDDVCFHWYRDDGKRGIAQAIAYYRALQERGQPVPQWPAAWQDGAPTVAGAWDMASQRVPPEWVVVLLLLRDYKHVNNEGLSCPSSNMLAVYDDVTHQTDCRCRPGKLCITSTESESTSYVTVLWLGGIAIAVMLIAVVASAVQVGRALRRTTFILELENKFPQL